MAIITALTHAAGQLVGIVVDDLFGRGDAHLFEHFNALFAGLLFVQPLIRLSVSQICWPTVNTGLSEVRGS